MEGSFCLYVEARPTQRETMRLHSLMQTLNRHIACVIAPSGHEEISGKLGGTPDIPWYDTSTKRENQQRIENLGIDAVICVSGRPYGIRPSLEAPCGTWAFFEGDPRIGGTPRVRGRTIAEGRSHVAMALRQLKENGDAGRVLAYSEVPRRAWDSPTRLRRRLDAHLPCMVEEAKERIDRGISIEIDDRDAPSLPASFHGLSLLHRIKDYRYLLHLIAKPFARLLAKNECRILVLHNPMPDVLDDVLSILGEIGEFVSYSEVVNAVCHRKPIPPGFLVTFDDGYKENMALLDVLDKYDCKAIFFLSTAVVDSDSPLWFMNKGTRYRELMPALRTMGYQTFLETIDKNGLTAPSALRGRFGLKSDEIRTLVARGHEVGLHTHNHPFLSRLNDDEIRFELTQCLERLQHILGDGSLKLPVAYPDGDYDEHVVSVLRDMGMLSAVTCDRASVTEASDPFRLPRYDLGDGDYAGLAVLKLTRIYSCSKRALEMGAVARMRALAAKFLDRM